MLFGTDYTFFPPLKGTGKWKSVTEDLAAINGVAVGDGEKKPYLVVRIFGLV
jgi:hypothetical protein